MVTEKGLAAFERLKLRRQADTLDLVVQGYRQLEVAHRLRISCETVKQHLQRARKILSQPNNVALAAYMVQCRRVELDVVVDCLVADAEGA